MNQISEEAEILFERRGAAGIVTLNRPKALNALTHGMVRALTAQLQTWADDAAVTRVIVTANGGRAFSAGGDIRALYELGKARRQSEAIAFWHDEYLLNAMIKHYRKRYISLIDGIVMGGGVGVSVHGSHRVAGDKFQFAMPEVGIGFFPDVGATWFLPRMPGELGTWCALTGNRITASDAVFSTIATHRVASGRLPKLLDALCGTVSVDAVLAAFAEPNEAGPLAARLPFINKAFAHNSVEDVMLDLKREATGGSSDASWASETLTTMQGRSPTSRKIVLAQVRLGARSSFAECLRAEFRIVSRIVYGHDFYEGVRAVIIDKDNAPHWKPDTLAAVTTHDVQQHFAPLEAELNVT